MAEKRIIYTSEVDSSDEAINTYREEHLDENPDMETMSEYAVIQMMNEDNVVWAEEERVNLDIPTDYPVLIIADLGLWNGRKQGYRVLRSNVNSIFDQMYDSITIYADQYNVYADDSHHDGTNHYLFRQLRQSEADSSVFLEKVASGEEITSALLNRYTRSILPHVATVYGWPCSARKKVRV